MPILPESMDRLDLNETKASLSTIESYIRYMAERLDFAVSVQNKTIAALETKIKALESADKEG